MLAPFPLSYLFQITFLKQHLSKPSSFLQAYLPTYFCRPPFIWATQAVSETLTHGSSGTQSVSHNHIHSEWRTAQNADDYWKLTHENGWTWIKIQSLWLQPCRLFTLDITIFFYYNLKSLFPWSLQSWIFELAKILIPTICYPRQQTNTKTIESQKR